MSLGRRSRSLAVAMAGCAVIACGGTLPPPVMPPAPPPPDQTATGPAGATVRLSPPPARSSLAGVVVDEVTRAPLSRARVILTSPTLADPRVTIAGADGAFRFDRVPAGAYIVSASRSGYVSRRHGEQRFTPPAPIALREGQAATGIEIGLPRGGVIHGQVLDEDGEPFAGAMVDAIDVRSDGGQPTPVSMAAGRTDDRGAFRLAGLPAGEYYVSAFDPAFASAGDESGPLRYTATYYPGVAMAEQATRVSVVPGVEPAEPLVFTLQIVMPARVSGRLSAEDGRTLTSGAVIMSPQGGDALPSLTSQDVTMRPDGTFEFRNVPPGRYEIRARGETAPQSTSLFAAFRVSVLDRDVTNLELVLVPGATVTGRLLTEAVRTPKPLTYAGLRIRAPFADGTSFGDAITGDIGPDGSFAIRGLMSGSHVITVDGLRDPWVLKSVWHRGQDITDLGLEAASGQQFHDVRVTITDVATELSGRVFGTSGAAAGHATVIVLPLAAQFWTRTSRRIGLVRADSAGRYHLRGLPPGEYRAVASHDLDDMVLHRPDLLPRLAAVGTPLTLRGAESHVVDLPLASSAVLNLISSR